MTNSTTEQPTPARALASVLFAWCSLYALHIYGQVHSLPTRFSRDGHDAFHRVLSLAGPIRDELEVGYRVLAAMSLAWCVWSWRTEAKSPALVATAFASLAVICAVFVVI